MRNFARRAGLICGALSVVVTAACSSKSSNSGDGGLTGLTTSGVGVGSSTTSMPGTGNTTGTTTTTSGSTTSTTTGVPPTSTTTGGSTTSGAGGSSGTGGNCAKACARLDALHCPQDTPGNCARTTCSFPICHLEIEALAVCILGAALACDATGQANTNDCDGEVKALNDCAAAGGP